MALQETLVSLPKGEIHLYAESLQKTYTVPVGTKAGPRSCTGLVHKGEIHPQCLLLPICAVSKLRQLFQTAVSSQTQMQNLKIRLHLSASHDIRHLIEKAQLALSKLNWHCKPNRRKCWAKFSATSNSLLNAMQLHTFTSTEDLPLMYL